MSEIILNNEVSVLDSSFQIFGMVGKILKEFWQIKK
jgi:hypothetical protein